MPDVSFLTNLPPSPDEHRTGALPLSTDWRDHRMEQIPEVAAQLQVGAPPSYSLMEHVQSVYNQGSRPSCVAESTCGMKSIQEMLDIQRWQLYDATETYQENGGNGSNGVDTRRVLQYAQDKGLRVQGATQRYRIGSYAFAPQVAGAFEETLKAAMSVNRPCVGALLLPSRFGWESGGSLTSGYHQVAFVGYTAEGEVIILNSWGAGWGNRGFGKIPWSFITQQGMQGGYAYAYTTVDYLDQQPQPNPNPQPNPAPNNVAEQVLALVNGHRKSAGLALLALDSRLIHAAQGHAQDMATKNYFSHTSQDGRGPGQRIQAALGQAPQGWGENIAAGYATPEQVVSGWMASPGHRANILHASMTHMGLGMATGGSYRYYWCQTFARLSGTPPPPPSNLTVTGGLVRASAQELKVSATATDPQGTQPLAVTVQARTPDGRTSTWMGSA